ncbi:MAG: hypothetical protein KDJ19_03555 [Hyphomicrobiaceae bacterium]|nr:hypothetical protein [Hyphomicrobiaceae bacterium]
MNKQSHNFGWRIRDHLNHRVRRGFCAFTFQRECRIGGRAKDMFDLMRVRQGMEKGRARGRRRRVCRGGCSGLTGGICGAKGIKGAFAQIVVAARTIRKLARCHNRGLWPWVVCGGFEKNEQHPFGAIGGPSAQYAEAGQIKFRFAEGHGYCRSG